MRADAEEIATLGSELAEVAGKLFRIAARLADKYTENPLTCSHDAPLIRESLTYGVPADKAIEIVVRCPKCGAANQVGGRIGPDEELRPHLWHPAMDLHSGIP
jgi:hypothetical protein